MQTGKIERFPIIAMGDEYWGHLRQFIENSLLAEQTISDTDLQLFFQTDKPEKVLEHIRLFQNNGSPKRSP